MTNCKQISKSKLQINSKQEAEKIVKFIQKILKEQGFDQVVIGVSGGVDSATSLMLLTQAIEAKNIIPVQLPYGNQSTDLSSLAIKKAGIKPSQVKTFNIKPIVDQISRCSLRWQHPVLPKIRLGNIMARVRMILVYDLAKKCSSLVCGTENKSEHLLGYFTRYGDEASDFEPIKHLYKTQVYQLAEYLGIPEKIIQAPPSAGLWSGQTDEKQFGFSYQQADQILYLLTEKRLYLKEIIKKTGLKKNVIEKVINWYKANDFKQQIPYDLIQS